MRFNLMKFVLRFPMRFLFIAAFFTGNSGCTEPPPPSLRIADKELIDSLYRDYVATQKGVEDSLCELHFDRRVQLQVDSIMAEREAEIARYLERIKTLSQ